MKTTVRRGVFETNSSSTHSVMIQQTDPILWCDGSIQSDRWTLDEGLEQLKRMGVGVREESWGRIDLDFGSIDPELADFGRTEEAYNEFGMKLLYALVSFRYDKFLFGALLSYLRHGLKVGSVFLKQEYGEFAGAYSSPGFGTIDHDSMHALAKIFGSGLSFEDYLFRKDVYIVIDNEG